MCQARFRTVLRIVALTVALLIGVALPAGGVPPPPDNPSDDQIQSGQDQATSSAAEVGRLAGLASKTEGDIARLEDDLALKAELANKAAVDLQVAQSDATAAADAAAEAQAAAADAAAAIDLARSQAASFAAASFRQGSVLGSMTALLDAGSATELLQRQELLGQMAGSQLNALGTLQSARTRKANLDSAARAALDAAGAAQARADQVKIAAGAAQQQAAAELQNGQGQLAALEQQLIRQQEDYQAAIATVSGLQDQREQYNQWLAQKVAEEAAAEAARLAAEEAARLAAEEAERQAALAAQAAAERAAAVQAAAVAEEAAESEAASERAAADQEARDQAARAAQEALAAQSNEPFYDSCDAARAAGRGPIARGEAGYRSVLDGNGNGIACEGTAAAPEVQPVPAVPNQPYYDSCDAARAAGRGPIARGESGYRSALDPNSNGIACEGTASTSPAPEPVASRATGGSNSSSRGQMVVDAALKYLGTTYAWGGGNTSGPSLGIRDGGVADSFGDYKKIGFDCSGLTLYAWAKAGVSLPHYSAYQYAGQPKIGRDQLQPGDLVFYARNTSDPTTIHHVAMWMGNNQVVEAKNSGTSVKVSTMSWTGYIGAVRPGG